MADGVRENTLDYTASQLEGDEQGSFLTRLYKRYFSKLAGDLRRVYGMGPPDPDDVAQQAFERLSRQDKPEAIKKPEGFLWICSRNIIITAKRAERVQLNNEEELRRRYFPDTCDTSDPERVFIAKEQLDIVTETLKVMPERRRRIFILNRVHGLNPKEAGRRCGVSRSSAVRHIALATASIAEALEQSARGRNEKKEP